MTVTRPLISVGLPTYNRADTLRRAIESVEAAGAASDTLNLLTKTHTNLYRMLCDA